MCLVTGSNWFVIRMVSTPGIGDCNGRLSAEKLLIESRFWGWPLKRGNGLLISALRGSSFLAALFGASIAFAEIVGKSSFGSSSCISISLSIIGGGISMLCVGLGLVYCNS